MDDLLFQREASYPRLLVIQFPGMEVADSRETLIVEPSEAPEDQGQGIMAPIKSTGYG
jgi:hypothetical protein